MRLSSLFLSVGFLLSSSFASADYSCASANTQTELNQCTAQAHQAADDELNAVYQTLVSRLEGNSVSLEKLRAAQRAWIGFRDAECAFESSAVEGGSALPMVRNGCLEALTEARTERLQEHAHCEEGDISCPW
ncbi:hypothetical protein HVA01_14260 [Halovibrio variabilis]|uniref:Lysozyme inhibitor LprI-like N-terminal domain-containing protein n=1 Tax=Halovibrio variabilis TaxID=31910 RepID=A0A511UMH7_9GAMM|nr:lysozyme inhibitor LprI family protein [Halovibrio variabilis]GEN27780.1 hypothetical protein HVA01_14260 [Halovibrio variabilis]